MPCNGISVIILTYKGKAQLENCLASVVASLRNANDEVIVTEDGEDTETCEIIRSVSERFKTPIKHLTQADTDMRASTARNRGFLAATNDTILFIDHDILLPRNFLKQLGTYHQLHWVTAGRRFFLDAKCTEKIFKGEYPLKAAFSLKTKIKAIQ